MALGNTLVDAALGQTLRGVFTDRLEHPVARSEGAVAPTKKTLVDQRLQRVRIGARNVLCGVVQAAVDEHRNCLEEPHLGLVEQLVRPIDGGSQRGLPRVAVATAPEQIEAAADSLEQSIRAEERCPGCGELERERQLVETVAELTDRVVDVELDSGRARPLDEEVLTLVRGERRNGPACLTLDLNALAAGDEEPESRAGSQQAGEVVRKFRKKVLGVVQEQQDLLAEEGARYGIGKHLARLLADLQRLRDHGQDE